MVVNQPQAVVQPVSVGARRQQAVAQNAQPFRKKPAVGQDAAVSKKGQQLAAGKQRQQTLIATMTAIVNYQREFFIEGDETYLKPMVLKDIADITGYDISTISRVSSSKYAQTEFGIFPVKFFFSETMLNDSGEEISTREIKKIMQECIDEEDKRAPINDDKLAEMLKEKGYNIARRTVAKYREQLNIPVARLRIEI